ncbi:MAG: transcription termination/antitermination protein NusA [Ruminococcaceae bacterium]|nr:transcription termination/antitermination protein NusA [Oscillospiraceae bacterium]
MNKEFFEALDALEKEGISKNYLLEKVEAALQAAFKKENNGQSNVRVAIDTEKKTVRVFEQFTVVEEVTDPQCELTLPQAKDINKRLKLGDVYEKEVKTKNFNRISAQAAKMVIIQGIREAERQLLLDEYEQKKNDIVSARIVLIDKNTGNAILELGKYQATLFKTEQIPGEILRSGQYIKVYVVDIKTDTKEPVIVVSRKHPGLVKRLFELEVPEIQDGTVIIHSIAREAGSRTKISVYSRNKDVDPIGSCIGVKGMRKTNITNEIAGEKIDIIEYSENVEEFVKAALSPAQVIDVTLSTGITEEGKLERGCNVIVPQDQLSLAIGNKGQNARLAAKLTGYKIDIKSQF